LPQGDPHSVEVVACIQEPASLTIIALVAPSSVETEQALLSEPAQRLSFMADAVF
jgi:hypothetical protein